VSARSTQDSINFSNKEWLIAVTRPFKEGTVKDAAQAFRHLCIHNSQRDTSVNNIPLTDVALISVLHTLSNSPQQAEAFVKELQEECVAPPETMDYKHVKSVQQKHASWRPGKEHYHMVLQGWVDFDPPSIKRAQALLRYMEETAGVQCGVDSRNIVLQALARKQSGERAQAFFDQTFLQSQVTPDLQSFCHLLEAWSKTKSSQATQRAEAILLQMKKWKLEVNLECLSHVIECYAKSKRKGTEKRVESLMALAKIRLEREQCEPSIVQSAVGSVLQSYQNVRNAHRAEEILLHFVEEYRNNQRYSPTLKMCNSVLSTWSKSKSTRRGHRADKLLQLMENDEALPDPSVESYNAVLTCYASSNKPESASRAEALLRQMQMKKGGFQPNLASFTCVLIAWARSRDLQQAPIEAERILRDIRDRGLKPDRFVYYGLIIAWGRIGCDESIFKVEEYLQCIRDLRPDTSRVSSFKPTVVEYNAAIQAYANFVSKNVDRSRMVVERVHTLLNEMLDSEDESLRPNTLTYTAALKTLAEARRIPDRGNRAEALLNTMHAERMEISPYIRDLAKKCCTREPNQKQKAPNDDPDQL
jgi:hypothetical protein